MRPLLFSFLMLAACSKVTSTPGDPKVSPPLPNGGECDVVDLGSVENCGACGNACPVPPRGAAACVNGACTVGACAAGFADCDRDASNGCEADLSDAAHCGLCTNSCPPAAVGFVSVCETGECKVTCAPGTVRCGEGCAASCERWTWSNPPLTGNNLYAASFWDANVGLVGGDKLLLRTTDGGARWVPVLGNLLDHIETIQFISATHLIAIGFNLLTVGAQSTGMVSDDAGLTWRTLPIQTAAGNMLFDARFEGALGVTGGAGWTGGILLVTTDGGATWAERTPPGAKWVHGVWVRGSKLWAACENGLYTSTDRGLTWSAAQLTGAVSLRGVSFFDDQLGLAVGYGEEIFRTTDGGATWSRVRSGLHDDWLKCASFFDATHAIAVGFGGTVLTSSDAGLTWTKHTPYRQTYFFSAPAIGASAWVVGTRGLVFKSDDFGNTWARQTAGYSASFLGLTFPSATRGYAVGELGGILVTDDGGKTWRVSLGQHDPYALANNMRGVLGNSLRGVHFPTASDGWAVGDAVVDTSGSVIAPAVILHTSNGGASWQLQASGVTASLKAVRFSSVSNGWAVGSGGVILHTVDGGATWTLQSGLGGQTLTDVVALSDTEAWISGSGVLAHTVDSGATWARVGKQVGWLWSVRFADAMHGIAAGTTTDLKTGFELTTNGGQTWTTVRAGPSDLAFAAELGPDGLHGVAVLDDGRILRTADGGLTWALDVHPTFLSLHDVRRAGTSFVVGGEFGAILRGPGS